ncbi:MAG: type II toxin-antitoxin system VapC family toxin [Dehalococcoidia bacterium]
MVIDASVWVSTFVIKDAHHQTSRNWLHERLVNSARMTTPTLVLSEVAGAVARRTGMPELGQRAAEEILRTPLLSLIAPDEQLGKVAAHLAATLRLRGADAVYVAVALTLNMPLITWDQELLDRAGRMIQVTRP